MALSRRSFPPALLLLLLCVLCPARAVLAQADPQAGTQADAEGRVLAVLDADGREQVLALHRTLTAIPSNGPESGGAGEAKKAEAVLAWLKSQGLRDVQRIDLPDIKPLIEAKGFLISCARRKAISPIRAMRRLFS